LAVILHRPFIIHWRYWQFF